MDRYWLLTNTFYGNWLPGDRRGFVGHILEHRVGEDTSDRRIGHTVPGTTYDENLPDLQRAALAQMKGEAIHLRKEQAEVLTSQFRETAQHRGWELLAVAVMFNHVHLVVGVADDPKPSKILGDFKSWGTRKLTTCFGAPTSETWWTERGSKRKLPNPAAIQAAYEYVLYGQFEPLVTWSHEDERIDDLARAENGMEE